MFRPTGQESEMPVGRLVRHRVTAAALSLGVDLIPHLHWRLAFEFALQLLQKMHCVVSTNPVNQGQRDGRERLPKNPLVLVALHTSRRKHSPPDLAGQAPRLLAQGKKTAAVACQPFSRPILGLCCITGTLRCCRRRDHRLAADQRLIACRIVGTSRRRQRFIVDRRRFRCQHRPGNHINSRIGFHSLFFQATIARLCSQLGATTLRLRVLVFPCLDAITNISNIGSGRGIAVAVKRVQARKIMVVFLKAVNLVENDEDFQIVADFVLEQRADGLCPTTKGHAFADPGLATVPGGP
ncbi:MAG: hypothetical protein FD131_3147 [Rhodocyclaceae bacterium]|nr:MAG: hypothetical protein FD131_3147 [Rhodocyclaceae bacterium]